MKVFIGSEHEEGIKNVVRINEEVGGFTVKKERDQRGRILYYIEVLSDTTVWRHPSVSSN